jgi:hypothetical protein
MCTQRSGPGLTGEIFHTMLPQDAAYTILQFVISSNIHIFNITLMDTNSCMYNKFSVIVDKSQWFILRDKLLGRFVGSANLRFTMWLETLLNHSLLNKHIKKKVKLSL